MICNTCGHSSPSLSTFCTICGQRQTMQPAVAGAGGVTTAVTREASFIPPRQEGVALEQANYAGFVPRFFAFVIDELAAAALGSVVYVVMAAMGGLLVAGGMRTRHTAGIGAGVGAGALFYVVGVLLGIAAYILYFVKLETGPRQATIGKSILGLKVTDLAGGTISVGQSLGRFFIKNLFSGLFLCIGFLMALFTERKQALHDLAAGTLVVRR